MNQVSVSTGRRIFSGTAQLFLADALLFPTGLLTAAFLSRQLGPEGYGLFTLAATIISWVEWCASSVLFRTTVKFISEAEEWEPVGTTVVQQNLLIGGTVTAGLCLLAWPIAHLMHEPSLTLYLQLFALQILLFNLSRAHRTILVGLGKYGESAIAGASRWLARLGLIVLLVQFGFSVSGAILGSVGAVFLELAISRWFVHPPLLGRQRFPARQLWDYAVPLSIYSVSMRVYEKLDLMTLKALGGTAAQAGFYGAAQNLAIIPGTFVAAFAPVLLSTLGRSLRDGEQARARQMAQSSLRMVLMLFPFAALTAAAAPALVEWLFGPVFAPTAPLLMVLMFGAIAQVMISIATIILIAADKPNWTCALTLPMIPLALLGHYLVIPQRAAIGAAWVTTGVTILTAIAAVIAVYRVWRVVLSYQTLLRSVLVSGVVYAITGVVCSSATLWLLVQLPMMALLVPLLFLLFGEFSLAEITLIRSWIPASPLKRP